MSRRTVFVILSLLLLTGESQAKSWRGIVPLKSTRADVERLLGKTDQWGRYQFAEDRGSIRYREDPCVGAYLPLREDNCECMVSKETVVSIFVTLEVNRTLTSFHLDKTKYRRRPFDAGPAYVDYINWQEGVIYSVNESDDQVVSIEYVPAEADCKELIARNTPTYRNSWRGLIPLHSNRTDAEHLLGPPASTSDERYVYHTDTETVTMLYAKGDCKSGADWNVPAGVITEFWVSPRPAFEIRGLRLDASRFQRQESPPLVENIGKLVNYTDEANGIVVQARNDGRVETVISITYSPSRKDQHQRCRTTKGTGR